MTSTLACITLRQEIKFSNIWLCHFLIFMIICLNARNQENVLGGSREKCITRGCIQGLLRPIYIKLQKQLYKIKIAAFFSFCRICTWTAQVEQRGETCRQRKSRGIKEFGDVAKLYLKIFGDFPKTITWGILTSLGETFHSILRISVEA